MEIMAGMYTRRSIRNYQKKPVLRETVEQLLAAATMAPSASNLQPWAFAVIQEPRLLKDYSDRAKAIWLQKMQDRPDPKGYKSLLAKPDFNLFYNAETLIIVYGDSNIPTAWIDCCLAAQNLMLAAHALGLGSCWIGFSTAWFDSLDCKRELGIPENYMAVAPIIIGYPDGEKQGNSSRNPAQVLKWVGPINN